MQRQNCHFQTIEMLPNEIGDLKLIGFPNAAVCEETAPPVASNKLADKPVYVLTSSTTGSAAEYFVYNLKMLKRATIVDERTAGQQHSGVFRRITDHIGMAIQEEEPAANPFAVKDGKPPVSSPT